MIQRAIEIKDAVIKFLEESRHVNSHLNYILEHEDLQKEWCSMVGTYAVVQDGMVVEIIHSFQELGLDILVPGFILGKKHLAFTIQNIREYFQKDVLILANIDVDTMEPHGLYWCNMYSTVTGYDFWNGTGFYVLNKEEVNVLRDRIEEVYLTGADNIDKFSFSIIDSESIYEFMKDDEIIPSYWENEEGVYTRIGFEISNRIDVAGDDKLLVANLGNLAVGVILYTDTPVCIGEEKCYHINYMDIHMKYQGMGIEEKLIHEMPQYLGDECPVVLPYTLPASEAELFKSETWKTKVYTYAEWEKLIKSHEHKMYPDAD